MNNDRLGTARNLFAYVLAIDYMGWDEADTLATGEKMSDLWESYLDGLPDVEIGDRTLYNTAMHRPNNWGTMARASLAAVAAHRNDSALKSDIVDAMYCMLGDTLTAGYNFDHWEDQADCLQGGGSANRLAINASGATADLSDFCTGCTSIDVDGALPDDLRRIFTDDKCSTAQESDMETNCTGAHACHFAFRQYPLSAQLATVCALEVLYRDGTNLWTAANDAIERSMDWISNTAEAHVYGGWGHSADTEEYISTPWIVNPRLNASYMTHTNPDNPDFLDPIGRVLMPFADFTHQVE